MSLGDKLRTAREAKGWTLDDAAAKTFIRAHHLDAIERDSFEGLPPSRIRYFVRDYARSLGIDPEPLLAELPEIEVRRSEPKPPPPTARNRRPALPIRKGTEKKEKKRKEKPKRESAPPVITIGEEESAIDAGTSAAIDDDPATTTGRGRKRPRYRPIDQGNPMLARITIGIALLLIVALAVWYIFGRDGDPDDETMTAGIDTTAVEPTRIIGDTPEEDADTGLVAADIGDSLLLEGRFSDRVWYSISMDGEREDAATVDSGEVRQWRASETFSVSLGNAGGVSFTINGKAIDPLGPKGGTVRGRVIDKDGLRGATQTTTSSARRPRNRPSRVRRTPPRNESSQESSNPRAAAQPTEPRDGID